jgi:2-(1,2-epoxy-1,2-dihydrophenyl)acetyl-CoA isomerase
MTELLVDLDEGVAIVTLNRPAQRNALSDSLRADLDQVFRRLAADDDVRVVVLTGAGPAFCAGGDIAAMREHLASQPDDAERRAYVASATGALVTVFSFPKPLIAAINGAAAGAGCSLALAADLRIAADTARFSVPFVRLGLMPDWGLTYLLPRAVGAASAMQLALTGRDIDADTALRIGMVGDVVAADALVGTCLELAHVIAANAPLAVEATKAFFLEPARRDLLTAMAAEVPELARLRGTADFTEGVTAFLEKRRPRWSRR